MKFVYDLRKESVKKSLISLYRHTAYRFLCLYGCLLVFCGLVVLVLGLNFGGMTCFLCAVAFVVFICFALFIILSPMAVFEKTVKRLAEKAIPMVIDFGEGKVDFSNAENEQLLFSIPYNLILDVKVHKEWIILVFKPDYKNTHEIQERYAIPALDLYKVPVWKEKLMIQDIEEILRLVKEDI